MYFYIGFHVFISLHFNSLLGKEIVYARVGRVANMKTEKELSINIH